MQFTKKLTYANVVSTLCLFLLLIGVGGGAAYAHHAKIGTSDIQKGAVTTPKIKKGAVKAAKIKKGAVKTGKIAGGAVKTGKIAGGAVTRSKLAPDAQVHVRQHVYPGHDFGSENLASLTLPGTRTLETNQNRQFTVQFVNAAGIGIMAPGGNGSTERYRIITSCGGDPSILCVNLVEGNGTNYVSIRVFETLPTSTTAGPAPRIAPRGSVTGK